MIIPGKKRTMQKFALLGLAHTVIILRTVMED